MSTASRAALINACASDSIRCRARRLVNSSVTSQKIPCTPTIWPSELINGALRTCIKVIVPSGNCVLSTSLKTKPDAMTRLSSSTNLRADSGGNKSKSDLPMMSANSRRTSSQNDLLTKVNSPCRFFCTTWSGKCSRSARRSNSNCCTVCLTERSVDSWL